LPICALNPRKLPACATVNAIENRSIEVILSASGAQWLVRLTSHAHLRLVQPGVAVDEAQKIFTNFVELYSRMGELIVQGNYALVAQTRRGVTTVQTEMDRVTDADGGANVVTVYLGRPSEDEEATIVEWV